MKTIILSDLHLGNGGELDIFAGAERLPPLLDSFPNGARIIFNGDTFDFLLNEDPLQLEEDRAVAQAQAIAEASATAPTLHALGRFISRGGEALIRLGNHDVELVLPAVQSVFRSALAQPDAVAGRLRFQLGNEPTLLRSTALGCWPLTASRTMT
jgi:hypothetical protein